MLPSETLNEIRDIFARCRRAYPTIDLGFEVFQARLNEIADGLHAQHKAELEEDTRLSGCMACEECLKLLRQLHHEDLFLATACARGDRIAWEWFADQYLPHLNRLAAQAGRNLEMGEDLAQELVAALIGESDSAAPGRVPDSSRDSAAGGRRGKLQSYSGRGSLMGWLRAAVSHAAIDRFRRARKQVSLDELAERGEAPPVQMAAPTGGMEERLDARWGAVLVRAVQREISKLSSRDRLMLRLYHLDGVSLRTIGNRYSVHEATVSRWLDHARRSVRKRVEQEMRKNHGLHPREVNSLWRWALETAGTAPDLGLQCLRPDAKDAARPDRMIVTHEGEL